MKSEKSHLVVVSPNSAQDISEAISLVKTLDSNVIITEIARNHAVLLTHDVKSNALAALFEKFDTYGLDYSTKTPSPKKAFIADMDSTIITSECLDELADFAGLKAEISAITEQAMQGKIDFEGALTMRVKMLKGLGIDALQRCYDERVELNNGAKELLVGLRKAKIHCALVSGGFNFFTSRVRKLAGFHEDNSNKFVVRGGKLTGSVKKPILGKEAKLQRLEEICIEKSIMPEDCIAIGDGANDLLMIEKAGLGIAYKAKPIVAQKADARINSGDLRSVLYFVGLPEQK